MIVQGDIIQMKVRGNVKNVKMELVQRPGLLIAQFVQQDITVLKIKLIVYLVNEDIIQMKELQNVLDVLRIIIHIIWAQLNAFFVQQDTL